MIRKLAIFSFTLLLAACSAGNQAAKLDTERLIGSRESITHTRMLDGSTGEARVFPPGPALYAALDFIETLDASRSNDQEPRAGYLYWIAGYREGGEAFRLTFGSEIVTVNGVRYQLSRDISEESVEDEKATYHAAQNNIVHVPD